VQGESTGEGIRIGVVVQRHEDPVGVAEEPLVLLDLETGKGATEFRRSAPPKSSERAR